jgi:uncharacterized protein YggE
VNVSGHCTRSVIPDRGSINLVAEFQDNDLKLAIRRASETYEKVRDSVKKLNLKDAELTTSETGVMPIQEWVKDRSVAKGYRARMGLRVMTSEVSRIGEVIEIAAKYQVKNVDQLVTSLAPETLKREQEACLEEATQNAKARAQKLASAAGAGLGQVLTLSENWSSMPRPVMNYAMRRKMMESTDAVGDAPQIEAGREQLSVTVQAAFELK